MKRKGLCAALLTAMLAALLCGCACSAEPPARTTSVRLSIPENAERKEYYLVGETFTVPTGATISDGSGEYAADVVLRDPYGRGYVGETVLSEAGKYVLEYKAFNSDGALLCMKESFPCYERLYETGMRSSASFGTNEQYPDAPAGIQLSLAPGDTFTFNKVIDLSDDQKGESVLKFFTAPETLFTADARNIVVTFTDKYDPDNKVTVRVKKVTAAEEGARWAEVYSYVTANAEGQAAVGLESNANGETLWNGSRYILHKNDAYGASVPFSIPGGYAGEGMTVGKETFELSWDYAERQIYSNGGRIVTDLDETAFVSNPWKGFTTGEVWLSVTANNYLTGSCNLVITEIDGNDLTENVFIEDVAPVISLDLAGYDADTLPRAITGQPYPLFDASAGDIYEGETAVVTEVWYRYGTSAAYRLPVSDGTFTPLRDGEYTVVYRSADRAGNCAEEILRIVSVSDRNPVSIALSGGDSRGKAGERVSVPAAELSGGSGNYSVDVKAVYKEDPSIVYEIGEDGTFVPLHAGTYVIVYAYRDYIGGGTAEYTLEVDGADRPYLAQEVSMPRWLIRGAFYSLPQMIGYTFPKGVPAETVCDVLVKQDDEAAVIVHGGFTVTARERVAVTYRLSENGKTASRTYTVPVADVGFGGNELDMRKYFLGDFVCEGSLDYLLFYTDRGDAQEAELSFINRLLAAEFSLSLLPDSTRCGYDYLDVFLTDSEHAAECLLLRYVRKEDGSAGLQINGRGEIYDVGKRFVQNEGDAFNVSYRQSDLSVGVTSDRRVTVTETAEGKAFAGFPSGYVYLSIRLGSLSLDGSTSAGVRVMSVNNQTMSLVKGDYIAPQITANSVRGDYGAGETAVLPATYIADVLSPDCKATMRVTAPDGSVVTAEDGTVLDGCAYDREYVISLDQYGSYTVSYEASDGKNTATYTYLITAVDREPPVIRAEDGGYTASLGETVRIADVTATDDSGGDITVLRYLSTPSGKMLLMDGANAFVAAEAGIYVVWCYAQDAAGNVSVLQYEIVVT
ncbi:MAG TPA: hypothetical protein H9683_02475 [Firmicutes bacterium]|nr:hypothetical protein [Bacillota bacterium]